jgi:hypothetical protein
MPTPPLAIIQLVATFAVAFSARAFAKASLLLYGTILAPGRRTVCAALRAMGQGGEPHFTNYHRLLNRDRWSLWVLSRLLLGLIIRLCLQPDDPLVLVIDETLERRAGRRIRYKSWYHDAVRLTLPSSTVALGLRWQCLAILAPVPWSRERWALPFMIMPTPSTKLCAKLGKKVRHTSPEWAAVMLTRVRRWQPDREIVVVGDGAYATTHLVAACQGLTPPIKLVARLRLDAQLYAPPPERPAGRRGPQAQKGPRQANLATQLADPLLPWFSEAVPWYGGTHQSLRFRSGVALWHHDGRPPRPLRWVLVRAAAEPGPRDRFRPTALFCSDPTLAPEQIITLFVARWRIEITFEELRSCLGFETQRQWSDRAIERTTPCLFGIFSLTVLMAQVGGRVQLPVRQTSWYSKTEPTFSDVLAAVRRDLWSVPNYTISPDNPDMVQFPAAWATSLIEMACYST